MSETGRLIRLAPSIFLGVMLAAAPVIAAEGMAGKGKGPAPGKGPPHGKGPPQKREVLACKLGTEDRHARIAAELVGGKIDNFAYYSIWKPRTCSLHVLRGDAYSKWADVGNATTVTLNEEMGAVLIHDEGRGKFKFLFREVERMRYCGAEGRINGSLTVSRGKPVCELEGVMDDDPTRSREPVSATAPAEPREPGEAADATKAPTQAN